MRSEEYGDLVVTVRLTDKSGGIGNEAVRAAVERALLRPDTGLYGMGMRVTVAREGSAPPAPEPGKLEWHKGRHHDWREHDGFPRHAHSTNGLLTIDPHDTAVHFQGGKPFDEH